MNAGQLPGEPQPAEPLPARDAAGHDAADLEAADREAAGHGVTWWARAVVGALGVAGLGYGVVGLLAHVAGPQLLAVAAWLAVAVLLHDGVLVPLTTAAGRGLSKLGRRQDPVQHGIVRGALLVGAMVTLVTAPLLRAQQVLQPHGRGSGVNPTVLPGDYAQALAVFWLVLVVAAAAAVYGARLYGRRASVKKTRP